MSSTRLAPVGAPIAYEKYMSSPEFAETRGIPGTAVAAKAQLYSVGPKRDLLFFVQSLSMNQGAMREFAQGLAKTLRGDPDELTRFLTELCINPRIPLQLPQEEENGEPPAKTSSVTWRQKRKRIYEPSYIRSVVDGVYKSQRRYESDVRSNFVCTTIARQIFETFDYALSIGKMVVVEGESGTGKTTAAEAWCAAHQGQSRFVSLSGITHKTGFFQKLATGIGLAASNRKAVDMQIKVEDFFRKTRLMLVIDEAHYLFPQYLDRSLSPELVNWVNTALVNHRVPVALICTDQFAKLKSRAEKRTGWTSEQFEHRVKRYTKLPATPTKADLVDVARNLLCKRWDSHAGIWSLPGPEPDREFVKMIVGYALTCRLRLPAVADTIEEARFQARNHRRSQVNAADIHSALFDHKIPSSAAMHQAFQGHETIGILRKPTLAPRSSASRRQRYCNKFAQALQQ